MKVVLFCGGLGMRLREYSDSVPKAMVPLGYRPIIWHLMKWYAHHGHKDFILCLGYRGDVIKNYFLNYQEELSNDFVLSDGFKKREVLSSDIQDWRITFVETGLNSNIGQRLMAVKKHLKGEEMFLANYSDALSNLSMPSQMEKFQKSGAIGCFLAVNPNLSYHFASTDEAGHVKSFMSMKESGLRINGGYFIFKQEIFDYMQPGDELVEKPFHRLVEKGKLLAYPFDDFWLPMDTAKDKQVLDELVNSGKAPWYVWNNGSSKSW